MHFETEKKSLTVIYCTVCTTCSPNFAKCTISLHPTVENLNCKNPFKFKHHKISFSRPIQSPNGGLCGLASLYQALENTVYTPSELTEFSYPGMRAAITSEIGSNSTANAGLTDSALLDAYYSCKWFNSFTSNSL